MNLERKEAKIMVLRRTVKIAIIAMGTIWLVLSGLFIIGAFCELGPSMMFYPDEIKKIELLITVLSTGDAIAIGAASADYGKQK